VIYEGVSAEETPADAIAKRLTEARGLMEVAEARDRAASHANSKVQGCEASIKGLEDSISQLQRQLEQKVQALTLEQQERARWRQDAKAAEQAAAEARAAVPDTGVVEAELKAIEQHNRKVRENIAASDADAKAIELEGRVDVLNIEIEGIDAQKARALKEAQFPVPGLGLSDDTTAVTFNGLPLEQASQAEQLRVSVAIGAALNPSLQVLLVRQGSLLDSSGMTALAALAAEANVQVWVERVSDGDGPATVVIEDGEAKA
jgi:DNA repair exonuclease SbcCD ATPase subunit